MKVDVQPPPNTWRASETVLALPMGLRAPSQQILIYRKTSGQLGGWVRLGIPVMQLGQDENVRVERSGNRRALYFEPMTQAPQCCCLWQWHGRYVPQFDQRHATTR